ncbi:tryptophan--tRNA ligase [Comamonas serinivorans]|uniref:Tryptophan--tRNA ligase n=1 Tax=Comamonas serinivorans TaxID=1082851 RepID=A0A1Y0EKM6_9BURK|nr:tryptophan--tRNA ligase [Comamonas serinivorans]ARU03981.1 tryptophan--tRNA ligase [Comamonas serinivorans]
MSRLRVLTGITPSGSPHLGNYVGAIRPAVRASRSPDTECFYFLADYHALIKNHDPVRLQRSTLEIAASWMACGLSPEHVAFYRQSDVPQVQELTWLLTCVTGKGLLNRAHAYKAAMDKNAAAGADPDADVTAGLFMYPVLMAADILIFNANRVPVGRDQIQHIEMARDMASSFNHLYGELFALPEAVIDDNVATLPGLDGRKMSKSYDNTIPLFVPRAQLHKLINGIKTDSLPPGAPKSTEGSALFELYQAFATPEETAAFGQAFADGIAWGDAKQALFERVDREIAPMRERYDALMADPSQVEAALLLGAQKVQPMAQDLLIRARAAVGLKPLTQIASAPQKAAKKAAKASFKQYRDEDGQFRFKLVDDAGTVLLQSRGFASPKDAGALVAQLKSGGVTALDAASNDLEVQAEREVLTSALQDFQEH